jgi:trypsin
MVQLLDPDRRGPTASNKFYCGGTMLDGDSVLTAAHCFRGFTNAHVQRINVRVGSTRLGQGVERDVLRVWIHGGFNLNALSKDNRYDVAVITLNKPAIPCDQNGCGGKTTALANPAQDFFERRGTPATVVGWGWTTPKGPVSAVLREEHVKIWSDRAAKDRLNLARKPFYPGLMIAAAGRGGNGPACYGDSGGPLLATDPTGRYWQIGIASLAPCREGLLVPDVYTEVNNPSIIDFIRWASIR